MVKLNQERTRDNVYVCCLCYSQFPQICSKENQFRCMPYTYKEKWIDLQTHQLSKTYSLTSSFIQFLLRYWILLEDTCGSNIQWWSEHQAFHYRNHSVNWQMTFRSQVICSAIWATMLEFQIQVQYLALFNKVNRHWRQTPIQNWTDPIQQPDSFRPFEYQISSVQIITVFYLSFH